MSQYDLLLLHIEMKCLESYSDSEAITIIYNKFTQNHCIFHRFARHSYN